MCEKSGYDDKNSDMVPDLVDRFTEKKEDKVTEADVAEILDSAEKEENV